LPPDGTFRRIAGFDLESRIPSRTKETEVSAMPLNEDVKQKVVKKLEEYEGRTNYMCLDSKGRVTIGVGHLIKSKSSVGSIDLCTTKNGVPAQLATMKEKEDEYDNISKQPIKYKAYWYKQHTKLVMKNEDIDALLDKHIESFYKELNGTYKKSAGYYDDFDNLSQEVQLALLDMIFNLGAKAIVKKFPNFDNAIKAGDWSKAAGESNRPEVNMDRNDYVKQLLSSVK
jgi:GH24 family phage-related lysozyme (muramidase)